MGLRGSDHPSLWMTTAQSFILWAKDYEDRGQILEKTLILDKIEGRRRRRKESTKWLDGLTHSVAMNLSKLPRGQRRTEESGVLQPMGSPRVGHALATEQQKAT